MASQRKKMVTCPKQVGCDGAPMHAHREFCSACERTLRRREKGFRTAGQPGLSKLAGRVQAT